MVSNVYCSRAGFLFAGVALALIGLVKRIKAEREPPSDFEWLSQNRSSLQLIYPNKHIAILDRKIVGIGDTVLEAYQKAKKVDPKRRPLLSFLGSTDMSNSHVPMMPKNLA